jgi:hypothetical protein
MDLLFSGRLSKEELNDVLEMIPQNAVGGGTG